jgi:hypothetical protein
VCGVGSQRGKRNEVRGRETEGDCVVIMLADEGDLVIVRGAYEGRGR